MDLFAGFRPPTCVSIKLVGIILMVIVAGTAFCADSHAQSAPAKAVLCVAQAAPKDETDQQTNGADPATTPAPEMPVVQSDDNAKQTKRILGLIPNFRAISAGEKLPPQSAKDKFVSATQDSFDYSSIFIPAALAAYSMGTNSTPEFHQGAAGYGRYFWHSALDQTSENYMVEFVMPVTTREDPRYYTLGHGGFFRRTGYALSRAVITRSDSSNEVVNLSEILGAGASSGLSNLYYPSAERSVGNTGKEWGLDIGVDALSFVAREFWPDINRHIFHQPTDEATSQK